MAAPAPVAAVEEKIRVDVDYTTEEHALSTRPKAAMSNDVVDTTATVLDVGRNSTFPRDTSIELADASADVGVEEVRVLYKHGSIHLFSEHGKTKRAGGGFKLVILGLVCCLVLIVCVFVFWQVSVLGVSTSDAGFVVVLRNKEGTRAIKLLITPGDPMSAGLDVQQVRT